MTYVIANPHGSYTQFVRLLEVIDFSKDDVMFVLGDIVDHGSEPMDLLCDLSFRENIWAISGEHDRLAYRMLKGFDDMLKNGGTPDADYIAEMTEWMANGGKSTLDTFRTLDNEMREGVLEYLEELPEEVSLGAFYPSLKKHLQKQRRPEQEYRQRFQTLLPT